MWCSGSFTPPAAASRMTNDGCVCGDRECHSSARNPEPQAVRDCTPDYGACAQRRRQSRVSAHKTTVLPGGISSPTFLFCLCGRRKRPSFQRPPLQRGGLEICAADPRYTPSVASSGRISPRKCRDMRGRPSIYAFSGIIRAHISGMRVRGRSSHQNHRRRPDVRRTANKPDLYLVEI